MPKRVVAKIAALLERDIQLHYRVGERFLSVREAARRYKISPPSAAAAISQLVACGLLAVHPRVGTTILSLRRDAHQQRIRILMLSRTFDNELNNAILRGIRKRCGDNYETSFLIDPVVDIATLPHGEYLFGLGYNAIIAVGMRESVLPLYYLISHGVNVVSSVIVPELPDLCVVTVDVKRYSGRLSLALQRAQKRFVTLVSSQLRPETREPVQVVRASYLETVPEGKVQTISLAGSQGTLELVNCLSGWRAERALVAIDGGANKAVAAAFVQAGIPPRGNLYIYEAGDEVFLYPSLIPLPIIAPSYSARGWQLADTLISKLETGRWPEPRLQLQ
jgi:hypothetical protein